MNWKEFAREVRDVIACGWTTEAFARDSNGLACDARERVTTCWCLYGAGEKVMGNNDRSRAPAFIEFRRRFAYHFGVNVMHWNDTPGNTQAKVLAALDELIALPA